MGYQFVFSDASVTKPVQSKRRGAVLLAPPIEVSPLKRARREFSDAQKILKAGVSRTGIASCGLGACAAASAVFGQPAASMVFSSLGLAGVSKALFFERA